MTHRFPLRLRQQRPGSVGKPQQSSDCVAFPCYCVYFCATTASPVGNRQRRTGEVISMTTRECQFERAVSEAQPFSAPIKRKRGRFRPIRCFYCHTKARTRVYPAKLCGDHSCCTFLQKMSVETNGPQTADGPLETCNDTDE